MTTVPGREENLSSSCRSAGRSTANTRVHGFVKRACRTLAVACVAILTMQCGRDTFDLLPDEPIGGGGALATDAGQGGAQAGATAGGTGGSPGAGSGGGGAAGSASGGGGAGGTAGQGLGGAGDAASSGSVGIGGKPTFPPADCLGGPDVMVPPCTDATCPRSCDGRLCDCTSGNDPCHPSERCNPATRRCARICTPQDEQQCGDASCVPLVDDPQQGICVRCKTYLDCEFLEYCNFGRCVQCRADCDCIAKGAGASCFNGRCFCRDDLECGPNTVCQGNTCVWKREPPSP